MRVNPAAIDPATVSIGRLGAEYSLPAPIPPARADLPLLFPIEVRNTGSTTWPNRGAYPINLSYHWLGADGQVVDYDGVRARFAEPVSAGMSASLELRVEPPPSAGSYQLMIDLVEEGVGWFSMQGVAPLTVPVEVAPAPPDRPRACIVGPLCPVNDAVGNYMLHQLRLLEQRGYHVLVLLEHIDPRQPAALRQHMVAISQADLGSGNMSPLCRRAVQHFQTSDLYIFHFPIFYYLFESIAQVDHGVVIVDYHAITPPHMWGDEGGSTALTLSHEQIKLVRYADYAIAHSGYARDELLASGGISPERVSVLPYAVPLARFRPGPRDTALAKRFGLDNRLVLLYVGRMAGNKRVIDLVRALPLVRARHPDAVLLLVGDKEQAAYARVAAEAAAEAAALGVADGVLFTGAVDHEQLSAYYNSCDVYVTSSLHEGFCIPVIEALACGKPVVGARATALPETIGAGGLTFQPLDPADLARQILDLLDRTPRLNVHPVNA